jgi:hypothetical protein
MSSRPKVGFNADYIFGSPTEWPTLEWPTPAMTNPHVPNFKVSNAESDQLYEWPMGTNDLQT